MNRLVYHLRTKTLFLLVLLGGPLSLSSFARAESNHLINSSSPYLLQHAHNPVQWYPWGPEALEKARIENKPILLSVGYSTCYWCHVMEREIFENPAIAKRMNETLVAIKVDREQRPDLDDIYMMATQLITGNGGWPNNVFLTPDLKPFFAVTYLPAEQFSSLINGVNDSWRKDEAGIREQSDRIAEAIAASTTQENKVTANDRSTTESLVQALFKHYQNNYDNVLGGFYQAPKFPSETALLFLLEYYRVTHDKDALTMARDTLRKMAEGGLNDQVGGGFHRYSTDAGWLIPHFEKMLYNQALLMSANTELFDETKSPLESDTIDRTAQFVAELMTSPEGAFYSALDAETDAVEGAYYSWTDEELKASLDPASYQWLKTHYGLEAIHAIPGHKNTSGKVLYLDKSLLDFAEKDQIDIKTVVDKKNQVMSLLKKARDQRKLPRLDDKIITGWNGLMIDALARAGHSLKRPDYIAHSTKAADFILEHMVTKDGDLLRTSRKGKSEIAGYFEDYAYMFQALVTLSRVTGNLKYQAAAEKLAQKAKDNFWDKENNGYFFTDGREPLLVRLKSAEDQALLSGNGVMANAFLDLYAMTKEKRWKQQAEALLEAFRGIVVKRPMSYTHLVEAMQRLEISEELPVHTSQSVSAAETAANSNESKSKVRIQTRDFIVREKTVHLTVVLIVEEGWHLNANPASLDFLVPTSLDVRENNGNAKIEEIHYPEGKIISSPLGDNRVYEGEVLIPITIQLTSDPDNLRLLVRAQACKGGRCIIPSDWVIAIP